MIFHPYVLDCIHRYPQLDACRSDIQKVINLIFQVFKDGKKLMICGNGGSAADADHIAGEFCKGFLKKRPLGPEWKEKLSPELLQNLQTGLPALSLAHLPALNTAYANDCSPEHIFAQAAFTLGQAGDALLCISTSGSSKNVLLAAQAARAKGIHTIGLTGKNSPLLAEVSDYCISVPEHLVYKVQELHLPVYHTLCLAVEDMFFKN
jgi:D-sedoheptulose 7-phosphate isomerase